MGFLLTWMDPEATTMEQLADLPLEVQRAYQAFSLQPYKINHLDKIGAVIEIDAIAIIDNPNGIIYITRDNGKSFEVEQIVETIHFREDHYHDDGITVRPILKISRQK